MKLGAVILAAGYSSRMNDFKPLMQIGDESLLSRCVSLFKKNGVETMVIVTGHKGKDVNKEARTLEVTTVRNHDHDDGMYSSVCCGVKKLTRVDGFFLLPVDIPLVRSATVKTLIDHFDDSSVLFPCFDQQRGHPPLIPACFIPQIMKYNGEGGLKKLLEQFKGRDVAVWDQSVLFDMDRPEDYKKLVRRNARMHFGTRAEAAALAAMMMADKGVSHGREVAKVAGIIGKELNKNGHSLDLVLLHNAALLHDISKGQHHHEIKGADLLRELGLSGLTDCVRYHRDITPPPSGELTEIELVCLADKLVCGNRRVSVRHRYEEKLRQYKDDSDACKAIKNRMANGLGLKKIVEKSCGRTLEKIVGAGKGV